MTQNMFPMMINLWKPTHMTEGMKKKNSIKKGGYLNQLSVIVHQIKYRVGSIRLRLECIWSGPISPNWNIYYTYWQLEWVDKAIVTSHQHRYNGPNLGEFLITLHLLGWISIKEMNISVNWFFALFQNMVMMYVDDFFSLWNSLIG